MSNVITEACVGCLLCKRYCPVDAITGEKRKLHSIDPGICIECDVCGRVCAFKAVLDHKGDIVPYEKPGKWARPEVFYAGCVRCNICIYACPTGVILSYRPDEKPGLAGMPYLADAKGCIGCAFCADRCPTNTIVMTAVETQKVPAPAD